MGGRGPHRGVPDRDRDRWDKERGEKDVGAGRNGPRNFAENHRPMNPPGFGGARWGETRAGPGGRFRPDDRDREGYNGPGRFRGDEGRELKALSFNVGVSLFFVGFLFTIHRVNAGRTS